MNWSKYLWDLVSAIFNSCARVTLVIFSSVGVFFALETTGEIIQLALYYIIYFMMLWAYMPMLKYFYKQFIEINKLFKKTKENK
jgi:hypothetical protein